MHPELSRWQIFIMGFRAEIITTYGNLMIACVYYASPPPSTLCGAGYPWTFPDVPVRSWPNHTVTVYQQRFHLPCPPSLCLTEFKQSSYFLESFWIDLKKMSKAEETAAEQRLAQYPQLQSSNKLLANKFLASYMFQLQAADKPGCFCYVSFSLLHAWTYVL